jgi:uncharacterized protein (DUF1697 family)
MRQVGKPAGKPVQSKSSISASQSSSLPRHVALLRGINVGGKNKLAMQELAAIFAGAGCCEIATYIQSGNVVFRAPKGSAAKLADKVSGEILRRFGLAVPLVLRTAEELAQVLETNPFLAKGTAEETLHVMFLADLPAAEAVAALDAQRSPGDTFLLRGREVYFHLPNGVARTKLTNAYFDTKLKTVSTLRNWRTVKTLCEMATTSY